MLQTSKKSVEGFIALPALFVGVLIAVGILALIQHIQPKPTMPLYKAGDCLKNSVDPDSDEMRPGNSVVIKVLAVGKKNYQLLAVQYADKKFYVRLAKQPIEELDPGTEKVDCPEELNDPKTLERARNGR